MGERRPARQHRKPERQQAEHQHGRGRRPGGQARERQTQGESASTAPRPPGVGAAEPSALPVRKTTATVASPSEPPNARIEASRQRTNAAVSISVPPIPVAIFFGDWRTSSSLGTTPENSDRIRDVIRRRTGPIENTRIASTAAASRLTMMMRDGGSDGPVPVPVMYPNSRIIRTWHPMPVSWDAPTLAAAWPAGTPD